MDAQKGNRGKGIFLDLRCLIHEYFCKIKRSKIRFNVFIARNIILWKLGRVKHYKDCILLLRKKDL